MTVRRTEVAQVVTRCIAGAGGVALRGALSLDPERYHVTLVTGEGGPLLDVAAAAGMSVVVEPSLVSPISPHQDLTALSRLEVLFRDRRFDVVHTHSAKAGVLGRLAAHRAGVPLVVHTYHGFPFHTFQSPLRRAAYVAIERHVASRTDVVMAIGTGVATEALRLGLARPTTLRTVRPVVEADTVLRTPGTRAAARDALGLPRDIPLVGTVGRVDYQKAPEHMIRAVAALAHRDCHAAWIGDGPELERARGLARQAGVADRFHFLGERRDVARVLPAFDVFAMSSRYEGLPCAVVEAMRCGLPVVATAVNSLSDLVVPGETGLLVPAGRPELLADAIDEILDSPVRAGRMAAQGRQLAGEEYGAERLGDVLDEVYTEGLHARVRAAVGAGA